jgi:hypothetical protein
MRTGSTTARVMPCVRCTEGHTASTATTGTGTGRLLGQLVRCCCCLVRPCTGSDHMHVYCVCVCCAPAR